MVEHIYRNPQAIDILESEITQLDRAARGGPCLICGEWIEPDAAEIYEVTVGRRGAVEFSALSHVDCLVSTIHPSIIMPS